MLNEKDAAELIGMSVHWLRRKRWSGGGIPFVKMSDGGAVRYRQEDVELYIANRIRKSTSENSMREARYA